MELNLKLLNNIDNLVKLSTDFDSGFKIIYNLDTNDKLNEKNIDILYSITQNYILMRKVHGDILLMMHKFTNSINLHSNIQNNNLQEKKSNKNTPKTNTDNIDDLETSKLYDLSTFSTLLGNVNDLMNNIDYEYKKIALKYPKFINKNQLIIILIVQNSEDKYIKLIEELKIDYPEYKYKIIKCENNKASINKCEEELKDYKIKIKSNLLPLIYIVNNTTITEIPISKQNGIESIKNVID